MYLYKLAYRYDNGEIEGFIGRSLVSSDGAFENAVSQICRKLEMIRDFGGSSEFFDLRRVIRNRSQLRSPAEADRIKSDWSLVS